MKRDQIHVIYLPRVVPRVVISWISSTLRRWITPVTMTPLVEQSRISLHVVVFQNGVCANNNYHMFICYLPVIFLISFLNDLQLLGTRCQSWEHQCHETDYEYCC